MSRKFYSKNLIGRDGLERLFEAISDFQHALGEAAHSKLLVVRIESITLSPPLFWILMATPWKREKVGFIENTAMRHRRGG